MVAQDLALAERVSRGDQEAFDTIYETYQKQIYYHIVRMVRDRFEAEDLTQEVFLRAYQFMGSYSGTASLGRWLRRIATNLCIDRMRKRTLQTTQWPTVTSKEGQEQPVEFPCESPSPLEVALDKEAERAILQVVEHLPEYYRTVVIFKDFMDCSGEEIAREIQCPVGTVKSRLSRAHSLLRDKFVSHDGMAVAGA
ncbi:MAG: RNA polymerase sigma factor [Bacillota bacterium]|jgi:RNA polymerase sigma-70 factor (ECF subfamily)